jgi:hypothetical protein
MDIEAHGNDKREVIRHNRDWLNANRAAGTLPLPGAVGVNVDHDAYQCIAADIITNPRLDPHDILRHGDYLHMVRVVLPMIEAAPNEAPG